MACLHPDHECMDVRRRNRARLRAPALAGMLLTVAGCHTWKPASLTPAPGSVVRVTYAAPRDVVATDSAGDSVRIPAVREWNGAVVRVIADTIHVRMTSASVPAGSLPARTVTVAVAREPGVAITRRSVHVVNTLLAVWLFAGAIATLAAPGDTRLPGY